ncbi:MAG: tetratricopeptide repeat protein, partial [Myxococcota bacterium]
GADGEIRDFEVAFTFGVEPLQQYLVRLPEGRLQALAAAWDTRAASRGGQRWFHLHPEESTPPGDVLHWAGLAGSWNAMCADCHSTNVVKDYRLEDGSYETTWSDIDVSCEACHGRDRYTSRGRRTAAGRRRARGAARALAALSRDPAEPAIVRATALRLLATQLDAGSVPSVRSGLRDPAALVRVAAVAAAEQLPLAERRLALQPLLHDPIRAVRIEAARALAPLRAQVPSPQSGIALDRALDEYRAAQSVNAGRPESHVNLGNLHAQLGELEAAQREYETAIRLGPFFVPAYVNLAELQRMRGRDEDGERVLREALGRMPDGAALHYSLGLLRVRQQRSDEALDALGRAVELEPRDAPQAGRSRDSRTRA